MHTPGQVQLACARNSHSDADSKPQIVMMIQHEGLDVELSSQSGHAELDQWPREF